MSTGASSVKRFDVPMEGSLPAAGLLQKRPFPRSRATLPFPKLFSGPVSRNEHQVPAARNYRRETKKYRPGSSFKLLGVIFPDFRHPLIA
jgi:hypothetical protein